MATGHRDTSEPVFTLRDTETGSILCATDDVTEVERRLVVQLTVDPSAHRLSLTVRIPGSSPATLAGRRLATLVTEA